MSVQMGPLDQRPAGAHSWSLWQLQVWSFTNIPLTSGAASSCSAFRSMQKCTMANGTCPTHQALSSLCSTILTLKGFTESAHHDQFRMAFARLVRCTRLYILLFGSGLCFAFQVPLLHSSHRVHVLKGSNAVLLAELNEEIPK